MKKGEGNDPHKDFVDGRLDWEGSQGFRLQPKSFNRTGAEYFISFIIGLSSQMKIQLIMYKRPSLTSQPYHPVTDRGEFPMATSRICGGKKKRQKICPDRPERRKAWVSDLRTHLFVTFYYAWFACTLIHFITHLL